MYSGVPATVRVTWHHVMVRVRVRVRVGLGSDSGGTPWVARLSCVSIKFASSLVQLHGEVNAMDYGGNSPKATVPQTSP